MTKEEAQNEVAQKHFKTDWVNILRLIVKQKEGLTISKLLEMEDGVLELYSTAQVNKLNERNSVDEGEKELVECSMCNDFHFCRSNSICEFYRSISK